MATKDRSRSPKRGPAKPQDFIKGWPNAALLNYPELKASLLQSYTKGLEKSEQSLNYGDAGNGAYMLGHPDFLAALAGFLSKQYDKPVSPKHLMSTGGCSMGTDVAMRVHCKPGDIAVVEEPTYYLAFTMMRERGMSIKGVPMQADGMDLDALEALLKENPGKIKLVYTVPINHNPTGITMSDAKRARLVSLAKEHDFLIAADEAYQILNFEPTATKPLFYHDDAENPKVLSVGTFSKLIGPGIKVGWVHAHEKLLKPLAAIGFVDSGNNPVIFNSYNLIDFLESGNCAKHITHVSKELGERKTLMCKKLRDVGLEFDEPKGGYFVWIKVKGKATGRNGRDMSVEKDKFGDFMRLCFAWLTKEQIEEGIEYLRE